MEHFDQMEGRKAVETAEERCAGTGGRCTAPHSCRSEDILSNRGGLRGRRGLRRDGAAMIA